MIEQVKATINKFSMFEAGDYVLIGVSGGPDSVALLHVLNRLSDELGIRVAAAHLNHRFRGAEAAEDAEFVQRLTGELGIASVIDSRDVTGFAEENGLSPQVAAREVRYRFFSEAARQLGCTKVATAHNANDQAETVLFHFLRGSGPAGLAGVPPVRDGWIVRPLIEVYRQYIEEYCRDHRLATRLDRSNLKTVYTRNKIRLELIPLLEKEYNVKLVETLVRTSEIMRDEDLYLEARTEEWWPRVCRSGEQGRVILDTARLQEMSVALHRRVLRRAWHQLTGSATALEFVHLDEMLELVSEGRTGAALHLPGGVEFHKSYGEVYLFRPTPELDLKFEFQYELNIPGVTEVPEAGQAIKAELIEGKSDVFANKPDEILIDFEKVGGSLLIRSRKPGDRFWPHGMEGQKKLKKYLIDEKVPRDIRNRLPVLVTSDGQVVWVVGLRPDRRWAVSKETAKAVKLNLMPILKKPN